jgi:hypothetical protein
MTKSGTALLQIAKNTESNKTLEVEVPVAENNRL